MKNLKHVKNLKNLVIAKTLYAIEHLHPHVSLYPSMHFALVASALEFLLKQGYKKPEVPAQSSPAKDTSSALQQLSLFKAPAKQQTKVTQPVLPAPKP